MEGFTKIRNGLLDHALKGKLSPFDFGIYTWLIMKADFSTGIYTGCALTIAYNFGDQGLKEHIQKSRRRLRDRQFINYRNGDGKKSSYPILINKFSVTVGEQSGHRLNAWKHNGLVKPEYEPENGRGTVVERSWHGDGTVMAPNKDIKTIRLEDLKKTPPKTNSGKVTESGEDWAKKIVNAHPKTNQAHRTYAALFQAVEAEMQENDWSQEQACEHIYQRTILYAEREKQYIVSPERFFGERHYNQRESTWGQGQQTEGDLKKYHADETN